MRSLVRLLGLFMWNLALAAGWLCFSVIVLLTFLEHTGLLANLARDAIQEQVGALPVTLAHARAGWFETHLELEGLELGQRGELGRLEHVDLGWRLSFDHGFEITGIAVRGGRVWIAPELQDWLQSRSAGQGSATSSLALPPITVRGVQLDLNTRWGRVPLGEVDARAQGTSERGIAGEGRLLVNTGVAGSAPSQIYLGGSLTPQRRLRFQVLATEVPLSHSYVPEGGLLDTLRLYQPLGVLALESTVEVDLSGQSRSHGHMRATLHDGSLMVARGKQRIDGLALDLDASVDATDLKHALDPEAWECTIAARGAWDKAAFESWCFLGPARAHGAHARGFVHFPGLPLDERLVELAGDDAAKREVLRRRWQTFAPRGQVEAWAGFELPEPPAGAEAQLANLRFAVEARAAGQAGLSYLGWPMPDDKRDAGFPILLDGVQGGAVFAHDPVLLRPDMLGLVHLSGESACGTIRAQGLVHSHAIDVLPYLPGFGSNELELHFSAERLVHNAQLDDALLALGAAVPPTDTWGPFQPQGGTLGIDLRLVRKVDMPYASCDLRLELDDLTLKWTTLPLPLHKTHGTLRFRSDGKLERGLSASLAATLDSAAGIELALRSQSDPSRAPVGESKPMDQLSFVEAHVHGLSLTGNDKQVLSERFKEIGSALEMMRPRGIADVDCERVVPMPGAGARWRAELTPIEVTLLPENFQISTTNVRGRVIVTAEESAQPGGPTEIRTALVPVLGTWSGDVQVAFQGTFPGDRVQVWAAGIDLGDSNLRGALSNTLAGPGDNFDMSALSVREPVDMVGEILLKAGDTKESGLSASLFLRGNTFSTAHDFKLHDVRGVLKLAGKRLSGKDLSARLGSTAVALASVSFGTDKDGFRLETDLAAKAVPLDRDHLSGFIDKPTLDGLLDGLKLSGTLDIEHGHITIRGRSPADSSLEFSGDVKPSNMSIQLGLPWLVRSANARIDRLLLEGKQVRASAHIKDLDGEIAGRKLEHANLLVTYVEPRLSIEDVAADFEGGKLRPLGADAQRSGTVFSIGLEEPYEFQLALQFIGIELGSLSRGLFASDFATRGRLDATLRLFGDTQNLLDIKGSGSLTIKNSRLWSIPVFRALFSQLGLDNAAVFDSMYANAHVEDGHVDLSEINLQSPLLKLVCKHGTLDFDGDMNFDLQVRYELVDKLGPLTRLLYSIQNELLSVSVRGDMARPSVVLKNPISSLFGGGKQPRALPLPGFSPLPPRF